LAGCTAYFLALRGRFSGAAGCARIILISPVFHKPGHTLAIQLR